ncbi:unnamed protein product, partial [Chrysoparadoxa australica]
MLDPVQGACPNLCSGHGTCGNENTCTCNTGWTYAPDCSLRTCASDVAWADKPYATDTAHTSTECSGVGICDRQVLLSSSLPPFTGMACQRMKCPNNCNGAGVCMTMADLARFYGPDYLQPGNGGDGVGPTYSNWDADHATMCVCDWGYFGPDCSKRMCPKGDDPLTLNQGKRQIVLTVGATGSPTGLTGSITVHFNGFST